MDLQLDFASAREDLFANGASTAPTHISAPKPTSHSTEPVAVRMYQPRISASISKPIDVARSAGHWKRKLRTAKGARAGFRARIPP